MDVLPLFAPLVLAVAALAGFMRPGLRPRATLALAEAAAMAAFAVSLAAAAILVARGGVPAAGTLARIDAVSVTMQTLVGLIGWVVVRYARSYLDGEARQGAFVGWLGVTLAAVSLLVITNTLVVLVATWVGTSLALHRLLLFYPDRPGAVAAARKKFVLARLGDVGLAGGAVCLVLAYGTADIGAILAQAQSGTGGVLAHAAAALIAFAAVLKSAQFPALGWLTEVMETPTPVSALLHAGIINAGGFALIRFADVMVLSPATLAVLGTVGGFTALFGSVVMLTQPAVKTSLAWSTVGQMGFMVLECGLGLFPLALLHIVAHSLYKAHAFLSSGSAVDKVAGARRPGPVAVPGPRAVAVAFAVALAIYALAGLAFGLHDKPPQAVALGVLLVFGTAYMLAQGLADAAPRALTLRTSLLSLAVAVGYFALQGAAARLTVGLLPSPPPVGPVEWAVIALAIASFGSVAIGQAMLPLWAGHPAATGLRVHLSNGLYANALTDRLLGRWSSRTTS